MMSPSVPGMHGWGNLYHIALSGAHGLSPSRGEGLRAPFFFSLGVAGMVAQKRPRVWTSPFFPHLVQYDIPIYPRFLVRPRLLTRI
jgi:hypothetical protein